MKRRDFITLLGGTAVTWPLAARAQQRNAGDRLPRQPLARARVEHVSSRSARPAGIRLRRGAELPIEFRWADGRFDQLPALAAELVDLRVAVIFAAGGGISAIAAKAATSTIPIVFSAVNDPVTLRSGGEPQPSGRQRHGNGRVQCRARRKAPRSLQGTGTRGCHGCLSIKSDPIQPPRSNQRGPGSGACARDRASYPQGQHGG